MARAHGRLSSSTRVRLLCLLLCCVLLPPPSLLASGPRSNSPTRITTRPLNATRQAEAPAGLPDLNEARRRPRHEPRTIPPIPSTRRRCPPANRRCNEDPAGQARPRPTPPTQPRVGQAATAIAPVTSFASFAKVSFLAVVTAAFNGGRPLIGLPLSDFYGPVGGYSVTDAPPATLPLASAPLLDPPTGLHVTSTSDTQVALSWSPVATAANYRVERATSMGGTYASAGTPMTSSFSDSGVSRATSYLYRVCAADSGGNCVSPYSNLAIATAYSFSDPVIVTYADYQHDNSLTPTPIRLAHITQLREAVNAVRHLAGRPDAVWTNQTLVQYQSPISAADVQDLRDRLGEALSDLGVPVPVYIDQKLSTGLNGTTVKRIHITQLRDNATRGVVGGAGVASGQGTGLTGQYYGDTSLSANSYKLTRTDATVNFDWGSGSPDPSMAVDNFSVRWAGVVVPRYSETYTFYTTTDDGVRLWVDGQLVVDKWVDEGPTEWSGPVSMQAGRAYSIRMEFYEHWGGASAKLQWASASQAREVVAQSQLYPCWKEAAQYVSDFYQGVLSRQPNTSEREEWAGLLDQAEGGDQLVEQAQDLGRTLFNSQEYAAHNPDQHQTADAHQYVSDLYHGYMQRDPDQSGWDYWTSQVLSAGRAGVRVAFEQSAEFQEKVRRLCGTSAAARDNAGAGYNFSTARLDPDNRTGGGGADPLSRNFNWSIPLVSLPGRSGLDLGLTLSYNSLVWTKDASGVTFDADDGWPSPGFRLGFPAVEPKFYNPQLQQMGQPTRYSYLLVTPSGARVELRQVGTSSVYESADSSYLQLTDNGGALTLLTTDGTRLLFAPLGGEYHCYQVEDRNGNYISVAYYSDGRIDKVTETLGRTLAFNYDSYQNLQSITQPWKRETEAGPVDETHVWA
ncbi:MAG: PA14 domain-containing protein, partial [Acidobacteriota bacterium]|nr:PA14 domain-containing protein [Acidobacteriota bacterium]